MSESLEKQIKKRLQEAKADSFGKKHVADLEDLEFVLAVLAVLDDVACIKKKTLQDQIIPLLQEIVRKEGAFNRDQLTHAENCLELASKNASKVLTLLRSEKLLGFEKEGPQK